MTFAKFNGLKFPAIILSCFWIVSCDGPPSREAPGVSLADEPMPKVVPAMEAINSPDIRSLDPAILDIAEINKVLPAGPRCMFRYTSASPPILASTIGATGNAEGVIKLHGRLVKVVSSSDSLNELSAGTMFTAEGITLEVIPESVEAAENDRAAKLHFVVLPEFHVGYKGWYSCDSRPEPASANRPL